MKADEGCPTVNIDVDSYVGWLEDNEWVIGIIYVVVGPPIALFGTQLFPYVAATIICIFTLAIFVSMALAFGWMNTVGGSIGCLAAGLVLGVIAAVLMKRHVWLLVALLGGVGGFFGGALIFSIIAAASGWTAVWGWWVICCSMAVIGVVLGYKLGAPIVLLTTSFVGSYLFMRAWTLFFPGHYPSESEIMNNPEDLDVDAIFWVFVGVLAACFLGSVCYQTKRGQVHEDLDYVKA